jgi:FtsP/CotA-like multicopper oxidase with cupredoxin domain
MHTHLVTFQVLNRQKFNVLGYRADWAAYLTSGRNPALKPNLSNYLIGQPIPPDPEEMGYKDTVKAYPSLDPGDPTYSYVTRIRAKFTLPVTSLLDYNWNTKSFGSWVYHCHILEHEENDMMRPFVIK